MLPVIIPYYKKPEQLDKCVKALETQTYPVEVFIRDNNRENVYFTAAVNEGILKYLDKDCKYILLLNQDMYLEPDAVRELVDYMDTKPECGIAAPLQISCRNPENVVCAGGLEAFPEGRHEYGLLSQFAVNREIAWANGACMILRTEMIREIGIMDKNFVLICSDSDYCFTAKSRGWKIWSVVSARGIHEHGVSGVSADNSMEIIKLKDVIYFGNKWLSGGGLYKRLSVEGPKLSPVEISKIMENLKRIKNSLVREKSSGGLA